MLTRSGYASCGGCCRGGAASSAATRRGMGPRRIAAGITATFAPASQFIGLQALQLLWLPAITGLVVIATAAAHAAGRTPLLARRL